MQLKLTHSKRPMQEIITTWDDLKDRYLSHFTSEDIREFEHTLAIHGKAELTDESGTLYIEVIK